MLIETGDESALSIRAIADAVGVTPPSIYLHFADRNDLVFAVCEVQFGHLHEAMDRAAAGIADPMGRIVARGRAYVDFGLTNPEHYRIILMGRPGETPDRFGDERLIETARLGALVDDVRAAIEAGQIKNADPVVVACGLWMMVHGITSLLAAKPHFPWPDRQTLIDHVMNTYAAGLTESTG
jgi:AcrR family transcriptional regulator